MNAIDEIIENEVKAIKEIRAENSKKNRKPKYSNFAIKQLYNNTFVYIDNNKKMHKSLFITKIVTEDKIYLKIIQLLTNSEYILNKSYLKKYIAKVSDCSTGTVHNKIDELIELDVLENVDTSIRITRLFLRKVLGVEIKTINYKEDSKMRSKLMINRYSKGYRQQKQMEIEKASEMDLTKEKIIILNDKEILLMHKEKYTAVMKGRISSELSRINKIMNHTRLANKGINANDLDYIELKKHWIEIEKVYVISKRCANIEIAFVQTEMLEDVIDFNEYKKVIKDSTS